MMKTVTLFELTISNTAGTYLLTQVFPREDLAIAYGNYKVGSDPRMGWVIMEIYLEV